MRLTPSNTAVIVDSACDLPEEIRESSDVFILPIGFQIADKHFRDRRVCEMAESFHKSRDLDPSLPTQTLPTSSDAIRNFLIANIVDSYENLIFLCISSTRSKIYENAKEAIAQLPTALRLSPNRANVRLKHTTVIDTLSVFSGEALLAYYTIGLIKETKGSSNIDLPKLENLIDKRKNSISTYVIPNDLGYLRTRGKARGERSIGSFEYAIAKLLGLSPIIRWQQGKSKKVVVRKGFSSALENLYEIAVKAIDQGLSMDVIMVSYSGDIEIIKQTEAYEKLASYAHQNGVELYLTRMSIIASIYLGPNSISLSFSAHKELLRQKKSEFEKITSPDILGDLSRLRETC